MSNYALRTLQVDNRGNFWLKSSKIGSSRPYFAVTKLLLNDHPFAVLSRLTDTVFEQARMNFGDIEPDSATMFNFALALTKRCLRNGELPSDAVEKNFIVADTKHLQVTFSVPMDLSFVRVYCSLLASV